MKHICLLCLLFICHIALAQDSVKFSGHIDNPKSDSIEITYNDNYLAYYPQTTYGLLDKKGNFTCNFPFSSPAYIMVELKYGNKIAELMIRKGDSLYMTANFLRFDSSIHYEGRGADIQNFVAKHTLERGRMNQYTTKLKTAMEHEPGNFLKDIGKEQYKEMMFLEPQRGKLPVSFVRYWEAFYRYYNYFFIQQYPAAHQMIKLRRYTDTIPDANYAVVKEMPYAFNDSFAQLPPYLLYLTGVFETMLKADGYNTLTADPQAIEDSVYKLGYKLLPPQSLEYYMAQNLYGRAKNQPIARTESQWASFKKHWPESRYLPLLDKQVTVAERLAPGQPAPDIDINTPDGKHKKLSDLKGSVVYMGFWGSFCRPCVGEMLGEKKIKDSLKGKPVEFVYVSIDNDTATDNLIAKKYKIDGVFTHASDSWASKEVELYGVQGLPAYFLINEEGKFAVQRTPSPSQITELLAEIRKLLR